MANNDRVLTVSEPLDLLAVVPYQLGFRPERSLVVVCLRQPRLRVGVVIRVDLADLAGPHGAQIAADLLDCVVEDGGGAVVLAIYDGDGERPVTEEVFDATTPLRATPSSHARAAASAMLSAVADQSRKLGQKETLGVAGLFCLTRRTVYEAQDVWAEPDDAGALDWVERGNAESLDTSAVTCAMVAEGYTVREHRDALLVLPSVGADAMADGARGAYDWDLWSLPRRRKQRAQVIEAITQEWAQAYAELSRTSAYVVGRMPSGYQCGRLGHMCSRKSERDIVLGVLALACADDPDPARGPLSRWRRALERITGSSAFHPVDGRLEVAVQLLTTVAAHSARWVQADLLSIVAVLGWWAGQGALCDLAARAALEREPHHTLAAQMEAVLAARIPPGWVSARRTA